jgi:protein-disulfide isomerase
MEQVMTDYAGKVRWVYRHFPLSFHANAQKEAEAALCVGDLGGTDKYWSFVDKIFERTKSNGTGFALTDLPTLAAEVGVSKTQFESCLNGGEMASRVSAETADGTKGGATGTPTTFIVDKNGDTITAIPGAVTIDQVKQIIDQALQA